MLICLGTALSACQTAPPPEPAPPPVQEPPPPPIEPDVLADMLEQAEQALTAEHFTYPTEGSALALYQQILALDASQEDARRGLEQIVERYVNMAMVALERRQFARARSMLARARLILPDHPSIKPTAEQIRLLSEAERVTLRLQQKDLNDDNPGTLAELRNLGRVPVDQDCRFTIAAKNDAQGRWIYKTLASANPGARLRAQIEIRLPAGVERVCFSV